MKDKVSNEKGALIKFLVLDVDGTLTDGGIYIDANGVQSKKFNVRDGMGITLLHEKGVSVGLLSHGSAMNILEERARMLGIKHVYCGKEPKLLVLRRWLGELNLTMEQVAYIGDDVNDIEILEKVGFSACPHDAHFSLIKVVDVVLQRKGGQGCVREFIDQYLLSV
jgi:YrbI family 3-deoxy-D-manno-octulosonate 8-phosphate phosphatase